MKIGLISDTHSYLDPQVLEYFAHCDQVWHAGDIGTAEVAQALQAICPLKAVHGNIDGNDLRNNYPHDQEFDCEGFKVWITHIGGFPPDYTTKIRQQLDSLKPQIFVCGHSHILKIVPDHNRQLIHINPGAAGKEGFHHIRTLLRFDLNPAPNVFKAITNLEVIHLGKRGSLPTKKEENLE